jgi:hypothetical protein
VPHPRRLLSSSAVRVCRLEGIEFEQWNLFIFLVQSIEIVIYVEHFKNLC